MSEIMTTPTSNPTVVHVPVADRETALGDAIRIRDSVYDR
jgi:hypothetical protein